MQRSKDGNDSTKQLRAKAKKRARRQVESVLESVDTDSGLPFAELLAMERICEALDELGYEFRDRVYPPWVTLWAFLSQECLR